MQVKITCLQKFVIKKQHDHLCVCVEGGVQQIKGQLYTRIGLYKNVTNGGTIWTQYYF